MHLAGVISPLILGRLLLRYSYATSNIDLIIITFFVRCGRNEVNI